MSNLQGAVAVVTGAGGVLCSQFAKTLAQSGAKIALLDLNVTAAQEICDQIIEAGGIAKAYSCDVLNAKVCQTVAAQVAQDLGSCDILVNGAGGNHPQATTKEEYFNASHLTQDGNNFFNLDPQSVEFVFRLNFQGTLIPTQAFAKQMIGKTGCNILNISSMNAYTPLTKIPAYSGAKAAISNFTQWLAVHFSKEGIRVNAIAPGFFATAQNKALLFNEDGSPTARSHKILQATPMGRFGVPDDLAGALLFLLDNSKAGFITGVVLPVDGGFSAYSGV